MAALPLGAALLATAASGCGGGRPTEEGGDPSAAAEARDSSVVSMTGVALRLEPSPDAPAVVEVEAGTVLAVVETPVGDPNWLRVATWDDRRGWVPVERVVEVDLWSRLAETLGGAAPGTMRAAYPLPGGRWGIEAPWGSPGITAASTVWLVADSARRVGIEAIDSVPDGCGGRHRMALVASPPPGAPPAGLAVPAGRRPSARPLEIERRETLEPALAAAVRRAAADLGALPARGLADGEAGARAWGWSLGEDARWATIAWPPAGDAPARAAALVLVREADGWAGRVVVPAIPAPAPLEGPPLAPVAAYAIDAGSPTLVLSEALDYTGPRRIDIHLAHAGHYRRLRVGYAWGCAAGAAPRESDGPLQGPRGGR